MFVGGFEKKRNGRVNKRCWVCGREGEVLCVQERKRGFGFRREGERFCVGKGDVWCEIERDIRWETERDVGCVKQRRFHGGGAAPLAAP